MAAKSNDAVDSLRSDAFYEDFFEEEFDASRYANNIIQGTTIAHCLQKLSEGIAQLEGELHEQVATNHHDLIVQATSMDKLEGVLQVITTRVEALQKSADRIRERLDKPYTKLVTRTHQLARLQNACEILRRTTRFLYLTGRLREQARGGSREIAKMAYTLSELRALEEEMDLAGIDVVDAEQPKIREVRETVERSAWLMLTQGMESCSQAQTATALQVYRNLDQLAARVDECVVDRMRAATEAVNEALSLQILDAAIDKGTRSNVSANYRAVLWTRVEKMFSSLGAVITQVVHLQRTLAKKRDTNSQARFCDIVERADVGAQFIIDVFQRVGEHLQRLGRDQPLLRKAIEAEYPKLLRPAVDFWGRILASASTELSERQQEEGFQAIRSSIVTFETAYLAACLSRLFDPVNLMFPPDGDTPPSPEDVSGLCKTLAKELEVGCVESNLALAVARNVAKTVKLFSVRAEALRSTDADALMVGRGCTDAMLLNINLTNRLDQFRSSVQEVVASLSKLPPAASAVVGEALQAVDSLVNDITEGIFEALCVYLESTLVSMHASNYGGSVTHADPREEPDQPCSPYVMVLQGQIANIESEVLNRFALKHQLPARVQRLMQRLLRSFVRHASIVTPLTEPGKLRLAADMAQVELALAQLQRVASVRLSDLGEPYHALRSFRPLLFTELDAVQASQTLGASIPYSVVLHHLFSRSPAIKPPHTLRGWSLDQYAGWLSQHSESEALDMVATALDAYLSTVKARGEEKYAAAYPVMRVLLQRAKQPPGADGMVAALST